MSGLLQDKIAVITGGSRGIGYAISEAYLREGAKVSLCARDAGRLSDATKALSQYGEVDAIVCDVSKRESVMQMIDVVMRRQGRIDVLINNAAVGMTYGRAGEVDPLRWAEVIGVNLIGSFYCCHAVLPHMQAQGEGNTINLKGYGASFPSPRASAYGASKAGLSAFTRSLAREYRGSGICVNLLSSGVVKTRLLLNREATEEGRPYLKRAEPLIDVLAGDASLAAVLAVKIAAQKRGDVTGKEYRAMSKTKMALRLIRFALSRFFRKQLKRLV